MNNAVMDRTPIVPAPDAPAPQSGDQQADFSGFVASLAGIVPEHCILMRAEDTRPFECDGLSL